MRRLIGATLAAALTLSCETGPPPQPAPPALPDDTVAAAAGINAIDDPNVQLSAIMQWTQDHVGQSEALCPLLTHPQARDVCKRIVRRPHLSAEVQPGTLAKGGNPKAALASTRERPKRTAPGPSATHLVPTGAPEPLADASLSPLDCPETSTEHACAVADAHAAARRGDADHAATRCRSLYEPTLAAECAFEVAEQLVTSQGAAGIQPATRLCAAADDFSIRCLEHIVAIMSRRAPAATHPSTKAWAAIHAGADALRATWADVDPAFGEWQAQRLWSYAMITAYAGDTPLTGAPLDYTPSEAIPQIRGAVAATLLGRQTNTDGDLAHWQSALEDALAARPDGPKVPTSAAMHPGPAWMSDGQGEGDIPAVWYQGAARRAHSNDPGVDLRIALVEAAARLDPPATHLLEEARDSDDRLLAWTGQRLLDWLDTDPVSQARPPQRRPTDRRHERGKRPPPL